MKNLIMVDLAFDDWKKEGISVYQTEKGIQLSMNDFHSGTVFYGALMLDEEHGQALVQALKEGYTPTFSVFNTASLPDEGEI